MPDLHNIYEAVIEEKLKPILEEAVLMTYEWKRQKEGEELTAREVDYVITYNKHFCRQHFEALGLDVKIVPDNPFNLLRERNSKFTADYLKMFPAYIQNFQELVEDFKSTAEKILETIKEGRNVLLLTNHLTFGNIPIIIAVLEAASEQGQQVLDQVYTVLGASLMTNQREKDFILSLSNVLLTQPKTERGKVKGYEEMQDESRKEFGNLLLDLLKLGRNKKESDLGQGKIFIIAPSGTRDLMQEGKVLLKNPVQVSGLVRTLLNKRAEHVIIPIGVNDEQVYAGRQPQKGDVYLGLGDPIDLSQTEVDRKTFPQVFLNELARLVKDKDGHSIGEWEKIENAN